MMGQVSLVASLLSIACIGCHVEGFQIHSDRRIPRFVWNHDDRTSAKAGESSPQRTVQLPPVLQQIADERAEFHINLGRAMDVLRSDMPKILSKTPDFSIYHDEINAIDPSGVQLTGLESYKSAFAFLQTFIRFWFRESGLQYRMVYDFCRSSIRISWHCLLIPKFPLGRALHVDGISYYQLDAESGKIIEHKIETLIINNTPVAPPYGILSLLQQDALGMRPQGIPVGVLGANGDRSGTLQQGQCLNVAAL